MLDKFHDYVGKRSGISGVGLFEVQATWKSLSSRAVDVDEFGEFA